MYDPKLDLSTKFLIRTTTSFMLSPWACVDFKNLYLVYSRNDCFCGYDAINFSTKFHFKNMNSPKSFCGEILQYFQFIMWNDLSYMEMKIFCGHFDTFLHQIFSFLFWIFSFSDTFILPLSSSPLLNFSLWVYIGVITNAVCFDI